MQSIKVNGELRQFEDSDIVIAADGTPLPLPALNQVFGYTGSNLTSITVVYIGNTYKQTFSYDGSNNFTGATAWIKQ